jgi:hypothetical protein
VPSIIPGSSSPLAADNLIEINSTAHHVITLERAPEGLIPRLRGGDAAHDVLAVAHIEIEVGEELLLGQGVGRVDAEVGGAPGEGTPGAQRTSIRRPTRRR